MDRAVNLYADGIAAYLCEQGPLDRSAVVLASSVAAQLMRRVRKPTGLVLSNRKREVLQLVADGASNREAAKRLFISEASIKTHLQHIYDKLDVRDRAAAVGDGYVVGCDGARSTVRQFAGIGFEGGSYPQTFVLADTEADGVKADATHAFARELRGRDITVNAIAPGPPPRRCSSRERASR